MSDSEIPIFTGASREECHRFIRSVKQAAFAKGKQRDPQWMADFASVYFDGEALTWLIEMDMEVAGDWTLLQKALASKYLGSELLSPAATLSSTVPTPAAAPVSSLATSLRDLSVGGSRTGRIKIIADDPAAGTYVGSRLDALGVLGVCDNRSDALRVRFTPDRQRFALECLNSSNGSQSLGIIFWDDRQISGVKSTAHATLTTLSQGSSGFTSPWKNGDTKASGPAKREVWQMLHDGTLRPIWSYEGCHYVLSAAINLGAKRVLFLSNVESYIAYQSKIKYCRASLVFEAD